MSILRRCVIPILRSGDKNLGSIVKQRDASDFEKPLVFFVHFIGLLTYLRCSTIDGGRGSRIPHTTLPDPVIDERRKMTI